MSDTLNEAKAAIDRQAAPLVRGGWGDPSADDAFQRRARAGARRRLRRWYRQLREDILESDRSCREEMGRSGSH